MRFGYAILKYVSDVAAMLAFYQNGAQCSAHIEQQLGGGVARLA